MLWSKQKFYNGIHVAVYALYKFPSICLRFFETNHGPSEGDSADSAISYAISHAGNLFIPWQLYPVIQLAQSKNPYIVIPMNYSDFFRFQSFVQRTSRIIIKEE